jgi:hypothetical protein
MGAYSMAATVEYHLSAISEVNSFEENSSDTENMQGIDVCSVIRGVHSFGVQQEGGTSDTTIGAPAGDSDSNSGREPCGNSAGPDHDTDVANRQRERHHD